MPYIINKGDLLGIHSELEKSVNELQSIWDDKQYKYFREKYTDILINDLKDIVDEIDECVYRILNLQSKLENL